jgi:hypothetical protein
MLTGFKDTPPSRKGRRGFFTPAANEALRHGFHLTGLFQSRRFRFGNFGAATPKYRKRNGFSRHYLYPFPCSKFLVVKKSLPTV